MSKNFELLQQLGQDEEVFQTAVQSGDTVSAADGEPGPELDKETLEKFLQQASLPDVFQITSEPDRRTLTVRSELSPDLNTKNPSRNQQNYLSVDAIRTSRNAASPIGSVALHPIGEPENHAENQVPQSASKSASF